MVLESPDLQALLARQHRLVSRTQALATGLDGPAIRRALDSARWRAVLPNVYLTTPDEPTAEQKRVAAGLYTASTGQITGLSALAWHGLRDLPPDDTVHILVPHATRRASAAFVRVQRTRRLDPSARRAGGYDVVSPARAAADAARTLNDLPAVRAIVAEAVGRGWTTIPALRRELDLAGASRTRTLRLALRELCETR